MHFHRIYGFATTSSPLIITHSCKPLIRHRVNVKMSAAAISTSTPAVKKRSVVSSFIFKFDGTPDGKPQVALFRRSDKVSTYRYVSPFSF